MAEAEKTQPAKYEKLMGKLDYDHDAVEQFAEAMNEVEGLKRRVDQLEQILNENRELGAFVWRTSEGITIPMHKIEDSHLENIMRHLLVTGRAIPRSIRGEANSRGIVIPVNVPLDWEDTSARRIADRKDVL